MILSVLGWVLFALLFLLIMVEIYSVKKVVVVLCFMLLVSIMAPVIGAIIAWS